MKILGVSDLHGDFLLSRALAQRAEKENVDMIVICGDIFHFGVETEGMIQPFIDKNKKVLIVPGNHDSFSLETLNKYKGLVNIHGSSAVFGDVGFFGCGGANVGPNFVDEEEMMYYLSSAFASIREAKRKVMVTHMHPSGSKMEMGFEGSKAVRKAIEKLKPDLHLCGHIHEAADLEEYIGKTKVISVGSSGRIIEV